MTTSAPTSLVLSGAGAKGAFHAGSIRAIVEAGIPLARIAGTSAGALNGAVLAAGVACGRPARAAAILAEMWIVEGSWRNTLSFSLRSILQRKGLSTTEKLQRQLEKALWLVVQYEGPRSAPPAPSVEFRCVATDLVGLKTGPYSVHHEREFQFLGADFMTDPGRKRIARAACASAAFPGLFAPVILDGNLLCDGGVCDNAPISYAIGGDVSRVIVVTSAAGRPVPKRAASHGLGMASDLVEVLINDRLSRDLETAYTINKKVARMDEAMLGIEDQRRCDLVRAVPHRRLSIVEVRPPSDLPGGVFSGLFSRPLREGYYAAGRGAALKALRGMLG